ncbi:MAG: hypothetical protein ABSE92_14440 [Terriglobales bacterium]|jgi:hypothetical protein
MLSKIGLAIAYFMAAVYFLSILLPSIYCLQHGCKGPGELDAFMPAFMLTPVGGIATAFSLRNAIQQIKKRHSWSWLFWLLAIIFAIVLLGIAGLIALFVYYTARHH